MIAWLIACAGPSVPSDAPDVVIVTVDTLRQDRLGFAGHTGATTPALDALAAGGRVFRQATTPIPRTTPALASLLTGRSPHHHGSREVGAPIDADVPMLAEQLRSAGWFTAAISAMRVAGPDQGLNRGFESFEVMHDAPAADVVGRARRHLSTSRPVLLWVHLADPHFPYTPHGGDSPCARLVSVGEEIGRAAIFSDRDGRASAALPDCRLRYDEEIARVDRAIGELIGALESRSRDRVVIFTADHGENQGERGLYYEHGPNLDDASLRVPFVVSGRGVVPGHDDGVLTLTDVMPALLASLGLPPPADLDGEDVSARFAGAAPDPEGRRFAESGSALQVRLFGALVSGRKSRWCVNDPPFSLCGRRTRRPTLHRHDVDPGLNTDVSDAHPDVRARLVEAAAHWPPETARERTVRTPRFSLVARPALDGTYRTVLTDRTTGQDVTEDRPDVARTLTAELAAWGAPAPAAPARDADAVEALRALGYVE